MEKSPEFSVVIVGYNHGEYIHKAIQSVLNQTFQDFEIIVFDDGSTDNTRKIVNNISDKRIKYFYQENSGLPARGRNEGISLATGKYISLLDGDDFWYEKKLEKCKKALEDNQDVDLICHNEAIIYGDRVLRHTYYGPFVNNMYFKLLFDGNCLHTSAVTIRRDIFFEDGFKFCEDKNLLTIEDYDYWLRLSRTYKFHFLPQVLGYYLVTESGAFLRNAETSSLNMLSLLESHFNKIENNSVKLQQRIRKRRSSVMCAAGRIYQHRREFKQSQKWYLKAIKEYPLNYKASICFLASTLNIKIVYR